eukprot:TRINITY_DN35600_c0_g1_i1.p1 TRINITY_DN35600_c0_g1~~TRINITY_DN35600_c0_g1_i1.p1  ORF type:complete len:854 (+),score=177.92 TRINITY_DN35600_c0_g1_i1:105-2564(+)
MALQSSDSEHENAKPEEEEEEKHLPSEAHPPSPQHPLSPSNCSHEEERQAEEIDERQNVGQAGPKRDSEGHAVSSRDSTNYVKLFVGRVPETISENELHHVFEKYGKILEVGLVKDKVTGRQKGYCFIRYETIEEAEKAINSLNMKYMLPGSEIPITVEFASGERERLGYMEPKLHVLNINKNATEKEIEEIFSQYGTVKHVSILKSSPNKRDSAFVRYDSRDMALVAIDALHDTFVMEGCKYPLIVRFAENKKRKVESYRHESDTKKWKVESYRHESDTTYSSVRHYGSTAYGLFGKMGERANPVRYHETGNRRPRSTGFDVAPNEIEPVPRPRFDAHSTSWEYPYGHKNPPGLHGLPFHAQSFNTGQMQYKQAVYDNQQPPFNQITHHASPQYQQLQNQQYEAFRFYRQPSPYSQFHSPQSRIQHSGGMLPNFPPSAPVRSQPQWKPEATPYQVLNQSPQAVSFPVQNTQTQISASTPLPLNNVLPPAIGVVTDQLLSEEQTLLQQPFNQSFQYPSPSNVIHQSATEKGIQMASVRNVTQVKMPTEQSVNHQDHPTDYQNIQYSQQIQIPHGQVQPVQAQHPPSQQQCIFPQQSLQMVQNPPHAVMQGSFVPHNMQFANQQMNIMPEPSNTVSDLSVPASYNLKTDIDRRTEAMPSGIHTSSVKSNWTEHTAPNGAKYYFNSVTRISQWVKPAELLSNDQKEMLPAGQIPSQQLQTVQPNMPAQTFAFATKPLPGNSISAVAETNKPEAAAVSIPSLSDARMSACDRVTCDWSEHTAPQGNKYYYNRITRVSQWNKPPELIAAEQLQRQQEIPNTVT